MFGLDPEAEATWLLREFPRPPGARRLVAHHLGPDAIVVVSGLIGRDAQLSTVNFRPAIALRARLPRDAERWALMHELAEWHLQQSRYRGEDVEQLTDAIAAALVVPRAAFRVALRMHGKDFEQLAFDFMTTPTCAALRLGEVQRTPIVVDGPHEIRVRGDDHGWPSDPDQLRRLVRQAPTLGYRRAVLGRRRVALWPEDAA